MMIFGFLGVGFLAYRNKTTLRLARASSCLPGGLVVRLVAYE